MWIFQTTSQIYYASSHAKTYHSSWSTGKVSLESESDVCTEGVGQASLPWSMPATWGQGKEGSTHTHGWMCQSACPYSSHGLKQQRPASTWPQGIQCVRWVREETHGRIQVYGIWAWAGIPRISGDPKYDPASGGVAAPVPISTIGRGTAGGGSARAQHRIPWIGVQDTSLSFLLFNFMPPLHIQKSKIMF